MRALFEKFEIILPILLLLSFSLRVMSAVDVPLGADEARMYQQALDTATGEKIDVFGHTFLFGGTDGRMWGGYVSLALAIPLLIVKSPMAASIFIALLNTLAIYGCYFFAKSVFSRRSATFATLLFLFNPWSIMASGTIWNPHLSFPFAFLFIVAAYKGFRDGKPVLIALTPALALVAASAHLANLSFFIAIAGFYFLFRPRIGMKTVGLAALFVVLILLPSFIYELATDFANLRSLIAGIGATRGGDGGGYNVEAFKVFQWLFTLGSTEIGYLLGRGADAFMRFYRFPFAPVLVLTLIASVAACAWGYFSAIARIIRKDASSQALIAMMLLIGSFIVFFLATGYPAEPRYLYGLFPVFFMLMGEGLERFAARFPRATGWGVVGGCAGSLVVVLLFLSRGI